MVEQLSFLHVLWHYRIIYIPIYGLKASLFVSPTLKRHVEVSFLSSRNDGQGRPTKKRNGDVIKAKARIQYMGVVKYVEVPCQQSSAKTFLE